MSRAQRLLDLIQALRGYRRPVSGATLAETLGISLRTVYRDIETLKAQGAHIDGEPGVGYVLRPGFMLPPLMFSEEEIEAIVLGSRWVADRADAALGAAARNAVAKIAAVLPQDLKISLDTSSLLVGPGSAVAAGDAELPTIRLAIRTERKLRIFYVLSAFPNRPYPQGPIRRQALSSSSSGPAEALARDRRNPGAITTDFTTDSFWQRYLLD